MIKSSLTKILHSFSPEEMKSFEKFVISPYFNTSEATAKLFQEIKSFYPEFDDKNFTKEYLFSRVYGKNKYNENLLRKLISNLIKLTADFLKIHGRIESKEFELNLLHEYSQRSFINNFEKLSSKLYEEFSRTKTSSSESMEFLSKLEVLNSDTYYSVNKIEKTLESFQNYANLYLPTVLIGLLDTAIKLEIDSKYSYKLPTNYLCKFVESLNWDNILEEMESSSNKILLEVYFKMYKLYKDPSDHNNFLSLKEGIFKGNIILEKNILNIALTHLESYCIYHHELVLNSMIDHLIEIYEFTLSNNLFSRSIKGFMHVDFYRNYLMIFARKRIDLAEKLFTEHIKDIDPEIRYNVQEYSEMYINFKKKNFEKALLHLNNIEFINFSFKYDVKDFLIKIHFELGNYEQVISSVESYKYFIKVENKSERYTLDIKRFLNFILKLVKAVSDKNKTELLNLKHEIELNKFNYNIEWVKENISQHLKL